MNHSEITSFIWGIANLIRDSFSRGDYQDVILPFTVLRRIDQVLAPTKEKVLEENERLKEKGLENRYDRLCKVAGYAFYNTSRYDFEKLLDDPPDLAANLRRYINGFSPNMQEVIDRFDFLHTVDQLDQADLLFKVMQRFGEVDLHPDTVPNPMMGTIFEELIRKFNEALDENPGQHFTPRDVVHLMVDLMLVGDEDRLEIDHRTVTVYDPCCGTGGMLTITKEHIEGGPGREGLNPTADVHLFGQEVNPKTYAVCKSDLFMKSKKGRDAENIARDNTLSEDKHRGQDFDYLIANPPYGKDWHGVKEAVEREHEERGYEGRFGAGTPRVNDGQLLFLQHMLSHRKDEEAGGSRIAIIMNGSPLFSGDAGSGESEIRRWILENDWLEALIALPEQMFYNTGISTYVWVLSNRKPEHRQGKVQLVDATDYWTPLQKNLGNKRREIPEAERQAIVELFRSFEDDELSKVFPTEEFGFRKIRVERPLRLNFQAANERIERLEEERAFQNLARSRRRDEEKKQREIEEGKEKQERIKETLREKMGEILYRDRQAFRKALDVALKEAGLDLKMSVIGNIENALGERDEEAEICRDSDGNPEHDTDLRDYERVPLGEDVFEYFEREVEPYVPDAWIDEDYTDHKDQGVGRVGYEINFNRYFYEYEPPRPLEEIQEDIQQLEGEIVELLGQVTE